MLNRRKGSLFLVLFFVFMGSFIFAQNRVVKKSVLPKSNGATAKSGAFIDINTSNYPESSYSITQLVKDVLISGGGCASNNVSNVVVFPNLPPSNQNRSWGYFNKATTNFPFSKGIILSTGFAKNAGNFPVADLNDDLGPSGDNDLAGALGIPPDKLNNATYIEFDFVAISTEITFKYLFASKEYQDNFPCNITDGFALFLKKVGDPTYTNLAVLPGGAGPVSVTNIRPGYPNCSPKNEAYYGGTNSNPKIETNFEGRTIPLTAKATVVPGQTYHFKMVLADFQDANYDSAVFLDAGSFDLGVNILGPGGVKLPNSVNMCDNAPQTFTASVQVPNVTYQWFLNNNPIAGATNASYTATQPGVYTVKVYIQGSSCPGEASITVVGGTSPTVQNATLTACYVAGNATFNLPTAQPAISTTPGATFAYYTTQADADAGNASTIPNPGAYQSAGGKVYVRVMNGFCAKVSELTLVKAPQMTGSIVPPAVLTCANSQITLDASASVYPAGATFNWTTTGGNIVSGGNTLNPVINAPGTYTLTISQIYQPGNISCTAVATVTVTGNSAPPNTSLTASKLKICKGESVTLTASGGATYNWGGGLPGNGNTQTVSPTVTTTYTVTAVGANGCASQNPATITIEVSEPFTAQNAILHKCYQPGLTYNLKESEGQITTATGVTFTYYIDQNDANAGNGNFIVAPTTYSPLSANQIIYVRVSNGGCSYVVSLQLLRTAETTLTIAAPQTVTCTTPQITLNASASVIPSGSTITWTTAGGNIVSGANTLTPVVNAGGTYTLTVTNVFQPGNLNCSYTSTVTVNQDTVKPIAALVSSQSRICEGESVTLTASGGTTYVWGNGLTGTGNTQTVSPTVTTTYTVTAVGANGCASATPATVVVQVGPPIAGVSANKMKICAGESVTLTATGGITYNWVGLTGNGDTQVVTPAVTTEYSVYALGGNGCSSLDPAKIKIEVVPAIVSTLKDVYVCAGDDGILDAGPGLNYTYLWSTGATTQTITTKTPGTYSVTISNGVCSKVFTAQLINPALPEITNVVHNKNTLTLTASNPTGGTLEYSIDKGLTWQDSNVFGGVLDNTMYHLMVRVKNAKCGTSIDYFTFVLSNAITPNMDGKNDTIDFSGISGYKDFAASIFDRYGAEVFKASKGDVIWRGSLKGINLPTGTYWYKVQWENPANKKLEQRSGWILLKNRN
ncbi:gliding motility-associated C-terminal domain-containing protein [Chryseobacterium rhizoplanae]|uniref:choice-of-anchor L domain-containing protein n=1 Tax=Chryseobacterium rhizoplanae TaxID=1609531 RepID=UPI001CE39A34|nr:choice-of-anchor L domain-containing protein [Chryseobacterium rhizoplanae]UCA59795.1 gliding motility-associated C-terminal domain-containing protein [Chryseobacterium rhizoplanae]